MHMAFGFFVLGLAAWLTAVFSPPIIALRLWHSGFGGLPQWIVHLLCGPLLVAVSWTCTDIIFYAAHDNGSGPAGLGIALLLPAFMLIGAIATYYGCVCYTAIRSMWRRLKVS